MNVDDDHPYYALAEIFEEAFDQASAGKGSERHAYGSENYSDQLICEMDRRLHGNADGPKYQAVKKIYESARMDPDRAIHELLGAINYTAAAIIILKEKLKGKETKVVHECVKKQRLYERFMEIQHKSTKPAAEKNEADECNTCPLNQSEVSPQKEDVSTELDDLFDDNFGVDQSKTSRLEIGE